ncbi:tail fiber domain-containing protein [Pseudonocardia sp. CA-107938]|uniref:tail fiber domain-containing protein n=1 Tax=Pseudonocardia sp. CA-107938 TaxID=3240021 RepID=UPI003D8F63D4
MADYTQPDVVNKRVRFFDGQFLQEQDLIDEQRYHLDRGRRLPALVGLRGVVTGLAVTSPGPYQVRVTPGVAVDERGRQLVLAAELALTLPSAQFAGTRDVDLVLVHQELPTDLAQTGSESHRRFDESPKLAATSPDGAVAVAPLGATPTWDGPSVPLATLVVSDSGAITVDAPATLRAGLRVPGRIGIGTSTPEAPLDVVGDVRVSGRFQTLSNDGGLAVGTDRVVGGHSGNRVGIQTGGAWRLSVGQDGHVGIGTTSPENAGSWATNVDVYGTTAKLSVRTASVNGRIAAHDSGTWNAPAGLVVGTHSAHPVSLGTAGASRLTVDASGNVGVGTGTPTARLHVAGASATSVDLLVEGRIRSNSNDGGLWIGPDRFVGGYRDRVGFYTGGVFRLSVLPNGHVGIGTTEPENNGNWGGNVDVYGTSAKLSLRTPKMDGRILVHESGAWDAPPGMVVGTDGAYTVSVATARTTHLTVAPNGNVGMGTGKRPATARLEVVGLGGENVDLLVSGRIRASGPAAGVWLDSDNLVGLTRGKLGLFTGGTAGGWRLVVDGKGRVGIGTEEPIAPVHIAGLGGKNVDLLISGTLRTDSPDGGMWLGTNRFVGATKDSIGLLNGGVGLAVTSNGSVVIGGEDPGKYKLSVQGDAFVQQNLWVNGRIRFAWMNGWRQIENIPSSTMPLNVCGAMDVGQVSDGRLKTAVAPIRGAGDMVARLAGVRYRWAADGLDHLTRDAVAGLCAGPGASAVDDERVQAEERRRIVDELDGDYLGFVAQDVERVVPELVVTDADGYKRIRYSHLTAVLVEAIKEQQRAIDHLTARLDAR